MEKNIGRSDRLLRLAVGTGVILAGIYIAYSVSRAAGIIAILAGAFMVYEALAGWCVLYKILGKNSCPIRER